MKGKAKIELKIKIRVCLYHAEVLNQSIFISACLQSFSLIEFCFRQCVLQNKHSCKYDSLGLSVQEIQLKSKGTKESNIVSLLNSNN